MKIMTKSLLLSALMIASVSMYAQKGEQNSELKTTIQGLNNKMADAILKGNDAKVMAFYSDNVISLPNNGKRLVGVEAIAADRKEFADQGNKITSMTLRTQMVTSYDNAVVEIGSYSILVETAGAPEPVSEKGKYLTVWVKRGDSYEIVNDIWNTDGPPKKARKKGEGKEKLKPGEKDAKKEINKEDAEKKKKEGGGEASEKIEN